MSSSAALGAGSLRVIAGPTAGGKSALAAALAARFPLVVLSADSRQVYRGFDIGTAKPSVAERSAVPHELIDLVEGTETFSAAAWAERAEQWLRDASTRDKVPVIVGGTGFYIRALVEPLFAEPPLDPAGRAAIAGELASYSTEELRRECERVDPRRAHLGRTQLLRAIEVARLTGEPMSAWHDRSRAAAGRSARYLVVDPGEALAERIARRAIEMLEGGWEREVTALAGRFTPSAPAWNATGYQVIRDLVEGRVSRAAAIERVTIATRQYAKRQRTWFRNQLAAADVTVLDPTAPGALDRAIGWWMADDHGGTRA